MFHGDAPDHVLNMRTLQDLPARGLEGDAHREHEIKRPRIIIRDRYLMTHSLWHTYDTMMRRSIPAIAMLALMGHRDSRVSEHYDHPEIADSIRALEGVREQIETPLTW